MAIQGFTKNIRMFDSHERGLLLEWATGGPFVLSDTMREGLWKTVEREPPRDALVAMDYTLDWLYAATRRSLDPALRLPQPWPETGALKASVEDIDLVVAWEDQDGPHLVLLEAKGFTGWGNKQMLSKAARLGAIFDDDLASAFDVQFVLVGPAPSKGLKTEGWPGWMIPGQRTHFMAIPDPGERLAVQRCNADGKGSKAGTFWRTTIRSWTKSSPAAVPSN